ELSIGPNPLTQRACLPNTVAPRAGYTEPGSRTTDRPPAASRVGRWTGVCPAVVGSSLSLATTACGWHNSGYAREAGIADRHLGAAGGAEGGGRPLPVPGRRLRGHRL